ncbi:MAG: 2-octaprenyl-6-methoxyphenyl hydroxylase [Gammaproteobacteria bacterium]|nr:MAG: 2-octaprenyl-6-methoxyphenyl hydroxylase [Gammaproteobacteria bacterium]
MKYDLIISGGSLTGLSLARALSDLSLNIAVIEARPLAESVPIPGESRAIALSYGSKLFLQEIGVWPDLKTHCCPIETILASEKGSFGHTRLQANQEGLPALGYVIPFADLHNILLQSIQDLNRLTVLSPAKCSNISVDHDHIAINFIRSGEEKKQSISARLLVGADGLHSTLRKSFDIQANESDYRQTAIIADIQTEIPHRNRAYERFSRQGPMALLPLQNGCSALVYIVPDHAARSILELNDQDFLQQVQERFGYRLGRCKWVSARRSFPLSQVHSRSITAERSVLLGNAAHTLHPVAGQGFNLGLRDVATLSGLIHLAVEQGQDIGNPDLLDRYRQLRRNDQCLTGQFTDGLVRLFDLDTIPIRGLRNLAMHAISHCAPLRHLMTRQTTGLAPLSRMKQVLSQEP